MATARKGNNPQKVPSGTNKGRGGTPPKNVSAERAALNAFDQSPSGRYLSNKTGNKADMSPTRKPPKR